MGCDMMYGPGRSVALWRTVLGAHADLWEAEFDGACVQRSVENGKLEGIHTLVGDQGDKETLYKWVEESGGSFDIIIDDGGHRNAQIKVSPIFLIRTRKTTNNTNLRLLTHILSFRRPLTCFSTELSSRGGCM